MTICIANDNNIVIRMSEIRKERFKRLATYRTNAVLEKLRLLGNLSNRTNYDYSDDDIKKIFSVVEDQLRFIKARFKTNRKTSFKL